MINLLPQDYIQRRSQHRVNTISVGLLAVVLASVAGAALVSERSTRNTQEVGDRVNRQYEEAARLIDQMYELENQKHKMLGRAKVAASLMERLPRSYVMAILNNALPKGASLASVKLTTMAIRPKIVATPGMSKAAMIAKQRAMMQDPSQQKLAVALDVKGRAATDVEVARFIAQLAKHSLVEVVDLAYSKESRNQGDTLREWHIRIRLRTNADALEALASEPDPSDAPEPAPTPLGGGA